MKYRTKNYPNIDIDEISELNQINDKTWMCFMFLIYSDPSSNMNKNMISLQKTNSCLLENNTKVLGNDEAEVNNQMSRKCKEENIRSYPKKI